MGDNRNNSGSMGKNESKNNPAANPNWPDFKGKAVVGGVSYWISGWVKKGDDGSKWMSLSFKEKDSATAGDVPSGEAKAEDLF
jgi:hypothetical protein